MGGESWPKLNCQRHSSDCSTIPPERGGQSECCSGVAPDRLCIGTISPESVSVACFTLVARYTNPGQYHRIVSIPVSGVSTNRGAPEPCAPGTSSPRIAIGHSDPSRSGELAGLGHF